MIALLLAPLAVAAAETSTEAADWLKVQAHVEAGDGGAAVISVGEPFHLVIEASHEKGALALLPEEIALDDKIAERKSARRHTRSGDDKTETDRYDLELLAFDSGDVTIPKIPLALGSTRAETNPIALDVKTHFSEAELPIATSTRPEAMAELEKMAAADPDAKAVLVDDYRPLVAGAAVALLALAAFVAWRIRKNRRAAIEAAPVPPPPPRPAHEVALERLAQLRSSGRVERGELKPYFVELSEIMRTYAGGRYGFDSLDLTIGELMIALSKKDTRGLEARTLEALLERADLVKFAKYVPEAAEATDAMSTATDIVEKTKAVVEAPKHVAA
jgi:hypothetical protein